MSRHKLNTIFGVCLKTRKLEFMRRFGIALIILFFTASVYGQKATIRGKVFDKATGEPIIGCNVFIESTEYGGVTDLEGFYNITDIQAGTYDVTATYIGYQDAVVSVTVGKSSIKNVPLYLESGDVNLGVVNISADRDAARSEVKISKLSVSNRDIKVLPAVGGEPDILQYLQVLPGVISTGDQGGQLFVRGGSPVQNKVLLDGITIYNPFHSVGFSSVFETDFIKNVDVLTGGFNAEYGGRISAMIDLHTRDGNKVKPAGFVSASPLAIKGAIEMPLQRFKEGGNSTSLLLTAKQSIIEPSSKLLYSYATDNDSIGLPFSFQDIYGKLSFNTANGSSIDVVGFNFNDGFNNPRIANIGWNNAGFGANFNLIPGSSNMLINGRVNYSDYKIAYKQNNEGDRSSGIRELGVGVDFTLFAKNSEVKYGIDLKTIKTAFKFVNDLNYIFDDNQNTTELAGFLRYKYNFAERLIIEPSVRLVYYASLSEFSPEPRLGLKFIANEKMRFKAAGGIYTQNLLSTSNERDVVNLFAGFLTGPEQTIYGLDGEKLSNNLQRAYHAVGGVEYDLTSRLTLNLEGYLKEFPQLIAVNRNKTEAASSDYIKEEGRAYGVDLSLKYTDERLYVWSTYSYGNVTRNDGQQTYPTLFDRRHNINFLTSYALGEKKDWTVSIRWNFGSGFPFTKTQGFYHKIDLDNGTLTDPNTVNNDKIGIIYSTVRNGGRLPYYHRMDASVTKKFKIFKSLRAEVIAGVTNMYNRKNIFYFDRIEYDRVDQLPFMPSASFKLLF